MTDRIKVDTDLSLDYLEPIDYSEINKLLSIEIARSQVFIDSILQYSLAHLESINYSEVNELISE